MHGNSPSYVWLTRKTHSAQVFFATVFVPQKWPAQENVARSMQQGLPATLLALFDDEGYKGEGLLALPNSQGIRTPTASEVSLNYVFLLPVVRAFPTKVGFMLGPYRLGTS